MKDIYLKDLKELKDKESIKSSFMILKKLFRDDNKTIAIIGDKTGDIKASIIDEIDILKVGNVINVTGSLGNVFNVKKFSLVESFSIKDYLPTVERPIEDIMNEIEELSREELKSRECITLSDYFFKDEGFLEKFKNCIAGVSQHHNYIGGLAEHTLNVMYLSKILAYRYNCRNKEIAILAAKLHDIGKTEEFFTQGPFSYTLRGEMEGHIVIGVTMLETAFKANPELYSEDFKQRLRGCIVQHHGKLEYGSPRQLNMEESYIVHFADNVDATFNKITQIREGVPPMTWTPYDKRIDGKLYI